MSELTISNLPPAAITQSPSQPGVKDLSETELLICFTSTVVLKVGTKEAIVIRDAPVLGVLMDLTSLWLKLENRIEAKATGFYDEYRLRLRMLAAHVECEDEYTGGSFRVETRVFREAMTSWSSQLICEMQTFHPDLISNPSFAELRSYFLDSWKVVP